MAELHSPPQQYIRSKKITVKIFSSNYIFEGSVHLVNQQKRITEVINDPRHFINLTDVKVTSKNEKKSYIVPFIAINKNIIDFIFQVTSDKNITVEDF